MRKWRGFILILCCLLARDVTWFSSRYTVAATPLVTVSLPDGAKTEYLIGETIPLNIHFNESVNMSDGTISAGVNGNGIPILFDVQGAEEGEYKQDYIATLLVDSSFPTGELTLGNLQGTAITSDGKTYYDSNLHTVTYDTSVQNLALDTVELVWDAKVFINGNEVTAGSTDAVARENDVITFQLFTMNIGVNANRDYFGEQSLLLNGGGKYGKWAYYRQAIPASEQTRNGIALRRYTYEFEHTVMSGDRIDPLSVEMLARNFNFYHNGRPYSIWLPEEVQEHIRNLDILLDAQPHVISAEPMADSVASNRDRIVKVTITDPSGADTHQDPIFYKWAKKGSAKDDPYNINQEVPLNGIIPITAGDVNESGDYYLYIRTLDQAGNVSIEKFGPYLFDVDGSAIEANYPDGSRFGGNDTSVIYVETEATVTAVTYGWPAVSGVMYPATHLGGGLWDVGHLPLGANVYELELQATDSLGNISSESYTYIRDLSAPTVTADVYGSDVGMPKTSHQVELTVEAMEGDPTAEGDSYRVYQLWSNDAVIPASDDSDWEELALSVDLGATAVSPAGANGVHYLFIKVVDAVGNEAIHAIGDGWNLDNTAPQLQYPIAVCETPFQHNAHVECDEADIDDTKIRSLTLDLVVDGKTGSELSAYTIEYYVSYSPILAYTNRYSVSEWKQAVNGQVVIGEDSHYHGVYYLIFKITDQAGNANLFITDGYTFDIRLPKGSIGFVKDVVNTSTVELYMNASADATEMSYSFDGVTYTDYMDFQNGSTITVSLPEDEATGRIEEGEHTIYVKFRDEAGNVSGDIATDTIIYDITPPVVEKVEFSPDGWTADSVTATLFYSDNISPESETLTREFDQNGSMDVMITDTAGNQTNYTIEVNQIDRKAPTIRFSEWGNLNPKKSAETVIYAEDEGAGIDESTLSAVWLHKPNLPVATDIDWQPVHLGESASLTDVSGTWYLYVKVQDNVGNEAIVRSDAFLLDNISPSAYIQYSYDFEGEQQGYSSLTPGPITAKVMANYDQIIFDGFIEDYKFDNRFTITKITRLLADGGEEPLYGGEGCPDYTGGCPDEMQFTENTEQIYRFYVSDALGNVSTVDTRVIDVIDPSLPAAEVILNPNTWTNEHVDVTVKVDTSTSEQYALRNFNGTSSKSFTDAELLRVVTQDSNGVLTTWEGAELKSVTDWSVYTVVEFAYRFKEDMDFNLEDGCISYEVERCSVDDICDVMSYTQIIDNLDQEPPVANLVYSIPELSESKISEYPDFYTNRNVTVRVMPDDNAGHVTVISPGGAEHMFTENGSHTFILRDEAGNITEKTVTIDRIEKEVAEPIVTYSQTSWTNQPVTAFIDFDYDRSGRQVKLEGSDQFVTQTEYVFQSNGTKIISYTDEAGNPGEVTLSVDWIDTTAPTGTVVYHTSDPAWAGEWTKDNVIAVLQAVDNSGVTPIITDEAGNELAGGDTYTFTSNGVHTFYFKDVAGNIGTVIAEVNRIDKVAPELTVRYSNERWLDQDGDGTLERVYQPTNGSIRATLEANEIVYVVNNGGSMIYDFTDNDVPFTFEVVDRAGNTSSIEAVVSSIDTDAPNLNVIYTPSGPHKTKEDVIAEITADEPIRVLNNSGKLQHRFSENGEFKFIVEDEAGNIAEVTAMVDWIDKSKVDYTVTYSETALTRNDVIAEVVTDPTDQLTHLDGSPLESVTFTNNGVQWLQAKDKLGNEYLIELRVTNIDKEPPQISFNSPLLTSLGHEIDPLDGLTASDNVDGDLSKQVRVIANTINPSVAGDYQVVYEVMDSVGNKTTVTRQATVVTDSEMSVYINGMKSDEINIVYGSTLNIQTFGMQGAWEVYWSQGKLLLGEFKQQGQRLLDDSLTVDQQGFYTILIQDQEQNVQIIHVYVIPVAGEG